MTQPETTQPQRHVVGFILGSIIVGIVGLVTAMGLTVSGTLNNFTEVSASYEDVFDTGTEIGSTATSMELEDANYVLLSFTDTSEPPSQAEQSGACTVTNQHGERVPMDTSSQVAEASEVDTADYDLSDVNHVIFANFEATEGTYVVSCEEFGLLSDGSDYSMGRTAIGGILTGVLSVLVAGALFAMGLYNHSRNRNAQRRNPRRFITYRLDRS